MSQHKGSRLVWQEESPPPFLLAESSSETARVVRPEDTLGDLVPYAERGGEDVVSDAQGNVYIANGEVFGYESSGK